jgi:hypothetical protein
MVERVKIVQKDVQVEGPRTFINNSNSSMFVFNLLKSVQ